MADPREAWNGCRYRAGDAGGHYESWFQRANHASRPLAFWIRYTILSPARRPEAAVGELWAIWFDGEAGRITAAKQVEPIAACRFAEDRLDVRIGGARLDDGRLAGEAATAGSRLRWELAFRDGEDPLLLLPEAAYSRRLPRAKAVVPRPNCAYRGRVVVDEVEHPVDDWVGSQNHNWGSRHTDHYAWGQVAGFDGVPESFLECTTARVRLGPLWTPFLTLAVLRLEGLRYVLNAPGAALRARASFRYFDWRFATRTRDAAIEGRFHAPRESFVGLTYGNPPGGAKTCLNTKIAACEVTLTPAGGAPRRLVSAHRAAFEILTDDTRHGVPVVA